MKKVLILSAIMIFNVLILMKIDATDTYKICRGFEPGKVSVFSGYGISLNTEGSLGFSTGFTRIDCCRISTLMGWCDFSMEHQLCKVELRRDSNPLCITGTLPSDDNPVGDEQQEEIIYDEEYL